MKEEFDFCQKVMVTRQVRVLVAIRCCLCDQLSSKTRQTIGINFMVQMICCTQGFGLSTTSGASG